MMMMMMMMMVVMELALRKFQEMHFTPCSHISYKKYWITIHAKLRWQAFPYFSLLSFLSKKKLPHNLTILCVLVPSPLPPKINFECYAFGDPPPTPSPHHHFVMLFQSYHQYLIAWLMHKLMNWEWHQCHIMKGYESMYGNRLLRMWSSHYLLAGCNTTKWKMYRTFN